MFKVLILKYKYKLKAKFQFYTIEFLVMLTMTSMTARYATGGGDTLGGGRVSFWVAVQLCIILGDQTYHRTCTIFG